MSAVLACEVPILIYPGCIYLVSLLLMLVDDTKYSLKNNENKLDFLLYIDALQKLHWGRS